MKTKDFKMIENYMLTCIQDSAHDKEHIYRVLYTALDIAGHETDVDYDVLITACLLHDIGRPEQFANPSVCHASGPKIPQRLWKKKSEGLYNNFYTVKGREPALLRQQSAVAFYESLLQEIRQSYGYGPTWISEHLQ